MEPSKRPIPIRLFNASGIKVLLDARQMMQKAQRKTGLKNFGEGNLEEALTRLLEAIDNEAQMHAFGRFITKERLMGILENRLRVEEVFRLHPEIDDIQIQAPIIITGLQRTGTTRLHRLIAAHPDIRSLRSWEALNPAPISGDKKNKKRKGHARTAEKALRYMSPDFFAIHPVEYEAPEEDVLLNDMTLISAVSEATMYVPSFVSWVEKQDAIFPYRYLKRILKLLQWQKPNKQWVLKTPEHLGKMDAIFQVFPDASIIHTYRDPLSVIPSFSSMLYHSNLIFSNKVDAEKLARHWMLKDRDMLLKAMNYWDSNPDKPVLHVGYQEMLRDASAKLEDIMRFVGLSWTHAEQAAVREVNQNNKQHKYGVHNYSLNQFKISKQEVEQVFKFYYEKFSIQHDKS